MRVGRVNERGKFIEGKENGKGKAEGTRKENAEERMEGKEKTLESTNAEEKQNRREKEDAGDERKPDLWSVFNLDLPRATSISIRVCRCR